MINNLYQFLGHPKVNEYLKIILSYRNIHHYNLGARDNILLFGFSTFMTWDPKRLMMLSSLNDKKRISRINTTNYWVILIQSCLISQILELIILPSHILWISEFITFIPSFYFWIQFTSCKPSLSWTNKAYKLV